MCFFRKQNLNALTLILAILALFVAPAMAQSGPEEDIYSQSGTKTTDNSQFHTVTKSAGSITPGVSHGGVISQLYVTAPPGWAFQLERTPGSFVDCGEGRRMLVTDKDGRAAANLSCGVTITETLVIPAASESARLIVHY